MTFGSFPPPPPPPTVLDVEPRKGLAVASLSIGILALALCFLPVLSVLIGGAAVALGIIALQKAQPKGLSWTGIVTGGLGVIISIIVTIAGASSLNADSQPATSPSPRTSTTPVENTPDETASASPSPTETESSTPSASPSETSTPDATLDPETGQPTTEAPEATSSGTVSEQNALQSAQSYLSFTAFSRTGLIEQLEYEGFSNADATWAVDNVTVNWGDQAAEMAETYLDYSAFSRTGLIDQLEFEGFSNQDAVEAVDNVSVDWNEQAAEMAQDYLDYSSFSRSGLVDQLVFEGFSQEQAQYGVDQTGL